MVRRAGTLVGAQFHAVVNGNAFAPINIGLGKNGGVGLRADSFPKQFVTPAALGIFLHHDDLFVLVARDGVASGR